MWLSSLDLSGLQGSLYLTHSGSFSRLFFALLWQSMEFKFFSHSSFTGKLDESMCPSFQVTNSVICQRLIHVPFFLAIFYSERRNPLLDLKLKLWPAIHARRGILSWMLLIDQWISRHYNYRNGWVWPLMQLQFRVLLSVQLLNIWPTTTILKRHLKFRVDLSKKKRGSSLVLRVFLLLVQPLGNEVREEDRRDCMKGHDRVIDPK